MEKIKNFIITQKKTLIYWFLLFLWMVVIFIFSQENSSKSGETSSFFINIFLKVFYPGFPSLSEIMKEQIIDNYQFLVRKLAHFTIFGILGVFSVLAYNSLKTYTTIKLGLYSLLTCIGYAIFDEIHQHFVPGRACQLTDVLIDSAGALLFILVSLLILNFIKKKKSQRVID